VLSFAVSGYLLTGLVGSSGSVSADFLLFLCCFLLWSCGLVQLSSSLVVVVLYSAFLLMKYMPMFPKKERGDDADAISDRDSNRTRWVAHMPYCATGHVIGWSLCNSAKQLKAESMSSRPRWRSSTASTTRRCIVRLLIYEFVPNNNLKHQLHGG
jgi:hypothetical protein